jgi:hypothetical protein
VKVENGGRCKRGKKSEQDEEMKTLPQVGVAHDQSLL